MKTEFLKERKSYCCNYTSWFKRWLSQHLKTAKELLNVWGHFHPLCEGFSEVPALRCCHRHSRKEPPLETSHPIQLSKTNRSNQINRSLLLQPLDHWILGRILHKFHHNLLRPVSFTLALKTFFTLRRNKALPKRASSSSSAVRVLIPVYTRKVPKTKCMKSIACIMYLKDEKFPSLRHNMILLRVPQMARVCCKWHSFWFVQAG